MRLLLTLISVTGFTIQAGAADLSRACDAARRADRRYTGNNAAEAAARMTAWEFELQDEMQRGKLEGDASHLRRAVEDIMAFGAQITDPVEGRRTLRMFIEDACR